MRAAIYARFSTDLQNPASIGDQVRVCRAHAVRIGAEVVEDCVFSDAAISAASIAGRPGLMALMAAAKAGRFDVVIAEALDRVSRDGGHPWDIFYDLRDAGVTINTISEGEVGALHIGLKGTMNAMFREEIARKTRRGQEGSVRGGRVPGVAAYGYRVVHRFAADGRPEKGLREIDPDQADIVRRIFAEYAAGISPGVIAGRLTAEGVPAPQGVWWNAQTIRGDRARGTGLLNNTLYKGEITWGRSTWSKDRHSGKKTSRPAGEAARVRVPAPELRIVDDEAWDAVHARLGANARGPDGRPETARRPKRLLSGLVRCATCGGIMTVTSEKKGVAETRRYVCRTRATYGPGRCPSGRTANADQLEARVLARLKDQLLHPEVVEAFVLETQRARAARNANAGRERAGLDRAFADVSQRIERVLDQVEGGGLAGRAVTQRLADLEARRDAIETQLHAAPTPDRVTPHPSAARKYRQAVERLQEALAGPATVERATAREALRTLITAVRVIPLPKRGHFDLEIDGDLGPLLNLGPPSTWPSTSAPAAGRANGVNANRTSWPTCLGA